jgi:hypothetical protein
MQRRRGIAATAVATGPRQAAARPLVDATDLELRILLLIVMCEIGVRKGCRQCGDETVRVDSSFDPMRE